MNFWDTAIIPRKIPGELISVKLQTAYRKKCFGNLICMNCVCDGSVTVTAPGGFTRKLILCDRLQLQFSILAELNNNCSYRIWLFFKS